MYLYMLVLHPTPLSLNPLSSCSSPLFLDNLGSTFMSFIHKWFCVYNKKNQGTTKERKHGLDLSVTALISCLSSSPVASTFFFCKWHNFVLLMAENNSIVHTGHVLHHPFLCCWKPRLVLRFSYCEYCCSKHRCTNDTLTWIFQGNIQKQSLNGWLFNEMSRQFFRNDAQGLEWWLDGSEHVLIF